MLFLGIEHKETYFHLAFTLEQLSALKFILDHATIEFDGAAEPEGKKAEEYLNKEFYPALKNLVEEQ